MTSQKKHCERIHIRVHVPAPALDILKKQKGKSSNMNHSQQIFHQKRAISNALYKSPVSSLCQGFVRNHPQTQHALRLRHQRDSPFSLSHRKCSIYKVLGLSPSVEHQCRSQKDTHKSSSPWRVQPVFAITQREEKERTLWHDRWLSPRRERNIHLSA